ncbi:hypothetical protein NG799_14110 [Laspinema sp. D1]|uniref:Uncharacterized protein n=1 Tax=Laspinema palackyanum D2a TaxID=2953684 RepID=A0ABT2MU00_9CYAN|nr:hypothetical protein [Laspinema sp. D2a]
MLIIRQSGTEWTGRAIGRFLRYGLGRPSGNAVPPPEDLLRVAFLVGALQRKP